MSTVPPPGTDRGGTPGEYFTRMYRDAPDPWHLATRWYERRKHALTVAALPRPHYRHAFEPGCSVGALSVLLVPRCTALLACDREPAAVARARMRLAGRPHVRVERRTVPDDWPAQARFDLVVLSELLYYLTAGRGAVLLDRAADALEPDGTLLLVHWRHPVAEHVRSGAAVHGQARAHPAFVRIAEHAEPDFLLDVFVRARPGTPARAVSVARAEGLA